MSFKSAPVKMFAVLLAIAAVLSAGCKNKDEAGLYNGVLEAVHVDVRSEAAGKVVSVPLDEGDKVEADEVICELDKKKLELQLRGGEGELTAQKAKLEAMEKGARTQELEQAKLMLDQARQRSDKAQKDYAKIERLYGQEAVSQNERDNAKLMRDLARDQAGQAEQQYKLVLEGVRDEELKAQAAMVDAVSAKVDFYKIQLDDAVIKSPIAGRLVERYVEPGELVMTGGLVATVADYTRLKVKVYLPEAEVGSIGLGRGAEVMVDAFPGKTLKGRVSHKSEEAEFTPKSVQTREERTTLVYEVTVLVDNPEEWAVAGLPADVRFVKQ